MARKDEEPVINDAEYVEAFQRFLQETQMQDIENIFMSEERAKHYPLYIDYAEFLEGYPKLAHELYFRPGKLLPLFDAAVHELQIKIRDAHQSQEVYDPVNAHVRLMVQGSALESPGVNPSIGRIRVKDVGRLVTLKGTVIRSGAVKMLEGEREYQCTKCGHSFKVFPELETGSTVELPRKCPSQKQKSCNGTAFICNEQNKVCHDYQEIKIQENLQTLGVGSVPRSIVAILEDDLVDTAKAGDDVIVTGELFVKWRRSSAESAELRDKDKSRFVNMETGCNGVVFIDMAKGPVSPTQLAEYIVRSVAETKKSKTRFCMKLLPIETTCHASPKGVSSVVPALISRHFPAGQDDKSGLKFAVVYESRANTGLDRMTLIDAIAQLVPKPHSVDLKAPQKTIIVQVVKTTCTVGIVNGYKELAKYNLRQLLSPREAAKDETVE